MAVVTISRQFGAGGRTLGERLCDRFGFQLVDEPVIDEIARKCKISGDWLKAMEKEASSTILGIISSVASCGLLYRTPASPGEGFEKKKYIECLTRIMTSLADKGGYVFVGRGAQLVLKDRPDAVHILLVAEYEDRVKFLVQHYQISPSEAEAMVKQKERQRAAVAANIFGVEINDPALYHMVVNTSCIPFDWAVDSASNLLLTRFMKEAG